MNYYDALRVILKPFPDKFFLQLYFKKNMGYFMDFNNPKTFNEKIQWLKIHDRKRIYNTICDKYRVRRFVTEYFGDNYLIPLIGSYDNASEINFDELPEQFVIKCSHDSGSVIVCRDKAKLNASKVSQYMNSRLKENAYDYAREWQYKDIKGKIIIEEFLKNKEEDSNASITDYKFFVFNGEPKFFYASRGLENHSTARMSFFDLEGHLMPFGRSDYKPFENIEMPENIEEMIWFSKKAAEIIETPFIRVDFYEIDKKTLFSEFTLRPCSGVMPFDPKEWDKTVGDMLDITHVM